MDEELEFHINALATSLLDGGGVGGSTSRPRFDACVSYSNSFWVDHLRASMDPNPGHDAFLKEVEDFLQIHFCHWQNVPRLIGELSIPPQFLSRAPTDLGKVVVPQPESERKDSQMRL